MARVTFGTSSRGGGTKRKSKEERAAKIEELKRLPDVSRSERKGENEEFRSEQKVYKKSQRYKRKQYDKGDPKRRLGKLKKGVGVQSTGTRYSAHPKFATNVRKGAGKKTVVEDAPLTSKKRYKKAYGGKAYRLAKRKGLVKKTLTTKGTKREHSY